MADDEAFPQHSLPLFSPPSERFLHTAVQPSEALWLKPCVIKIGFADVVEQLVFSPLQDNTRRPIDCTEAEEQATQKKVNMKVMMVQIHGVCGCQVNPVRPLTVHERLPKVCGVKRVNNTLGGQLYIVLMPCFLL